MNVSYQWLKSMVPIDWEPEPKDPRLPAAAVAGRGPAERIKLVPYGCTKFRISMFPVAAEAGGATAKN